MRLGAQILDVCRQIGRRGDVRQEIVADDAPAERAGRRQRWMKLGRHGGAPEEIVVDYLGRRVHDVEDEGMIPRPCHSPVMVVSLDRCGAASLCQKVLPGRVTQVAVGARAALQEFRFCCCCRLRIVVRKLEARRRQNVHHGLPVFRWRLNGDMVQRAGQMCIWGRRPFFGRSAFRADFSLFGFGEMSLEDWAADRWRMRSRLCSCWRLGRRSGLLLWWRRGLRRWRRRRGGRRRPLQNHFWLLLRWQIREEIDTDIGASRPEQFRPGDWRSPFRPFPWQECMQGPFSPAYLRRRPGPRL